MVRLADPRRRRSRAVLLEPPLARKKQPIRRQRVQPRPLLPNTTRAVAHTHASTAAAAIPITQQGCPKMASTAHPDAASTTPTPEETLDELLRDAPRNAEARARQEAAWDLQGKEDARRLLYEREVAARHA